MAFGLYHCQTLYMDNLCFHMKSSTVTEFIDIDEMMEQ